MQTPNPPRRTPCSRPRAQEATWSACVRRCQSRAVRLLCVASLAGVGAPVLRALTICQKKGCPASFRPCHKPSGANNLCKHQKTRQPFKGLAVVARNPGQCVRLTRLGTSSSVSMWSIKTRPNCLSPPATYPVGTPSSVPCEVRLHYSQPLPEWLENSQLEWLFWYM